MGGMSYDVFTKLYDSTGVLSLILALMVFIGTGKYTPRAAVFGEMDWRPAVMKQWSVFLLLGLDL